MFKFDSKIRHFLSKMKPKFNKLLNAIPPINYGLNPIVTAGSIIIGLGNSFLTFTHYFSGLIPI